MDFPLFKEDPVKNLDEALVRARLGTAYLDEKFGPDWDHQIDLNRLNIKSPINCVLSQLMWRGHLSLLLFLDLRKAVDYGFSCGIVDAICWIPIPALDRSFQRLTQAWKLVLSERRSQADSDVTKLQTSDVEWATSGAAVSQAV